MSEEVEKERVQNFVEKLCPMCMTYHKKGDLTMTVLEFPSVIKDADPNIFLCGKCKWRVDMLTSWLEDGRQNRAYDAGLAPYKSEEMERPHSFNVRSRLGVVRVAKDGVENMLCRSCLLWKPKSLEFFMESTRKGIFTNICRGCQHLSYRHFFHEYGLKQKMRLKKKLTKMRQEARKILRTKRMFRKAYTVIRVADGKVFGIYTSLKEARKGLRRTIYKYDEKGMHIGSEALFKVQEYTINKEI